MKTYIHPIDFRAARFGVRRSGNGLYQACAQYPSGASYASEETTYQQALRENESQVHVAYDLGYWPAWIVLSLAALVGIGACSAVTLLISVITLSR